MTGKTSTLKLNSTSKKIIWKSSDKTVATVSSKGLVTAKKAGKTTVSASLSGKKYNCIVTVIPKFTIADNLDLLRSTLVGRYLDVTVDGSVQSFQIINDEITQFKVTNTKVDVKSKKATIKATMIVDRTVAAIKSNILYTYSVKANTWKLNSVTFTNSIDSISLLGLWKGKYKVYGGDVGLDLDIQTLTDDGFSTAVFKFYPAPTNPNYESGSYTMKGGVDFKTGKIAFVGVNWIDQPKDYFIIDLYGRINLVDKSLSGNGYYSFEVYKVM
jgi:hypothetical protein